MSDYTEIDTDNLLPGKPLTSAIALALNENLKASGEGAPGAPKFASEALNMLVGAGTGTLTFTDVGRVEKVLIQSFTNGTSGSSGGIKLTYQTSTNNGATFASAIDIPNTTVGGAGISAGHNVISLASSVNAFRVQLVGFGVSSGGTISYSVLGVSGISP